MPPPPGMQRFSANPNVIPSHYQYPPHSQAHGAGLPPPSLNPPFMNNAHNPILNVFNNMNGIPGNSGGGFGGGGGLSGTGGVGLASQAAQMGFHSATTQPQAHSGGIAEHSGRTAQHKGRIREVWKSNLHEEIEVIRNMVEKFPYVSLDSAFPGLVARPMGNFHGKTDYHYQTLRCNVDFLQLMQLGISLFTPEGKTVPERPTSTDSAIDVNMPNALARKNAPCTWQFNFKFSLKEDMYSQAAIESKQAAGVDFSMLEKDGVDPHEFASLLISSGLVCDEDVRWISNHAGYDFGCLLKLLICKPMPDEENTYGILIKKFFPTHYDMKYLTRKAITRYQSGSLTTSDPNIPDVIQKLKEKQTMPAESNKLDFIAEAMKIKRTGSAHLAGSDSLLAGKVFFYMRDKLLGGEIPEDCSGKIWGLRSWDIVDEPAQDTQPAASQQYNQQLQENTTPGQNGASYTNGSPSTPVTGNAALSSTPVHALNGASMGPLTPGGGGGVFGNFQFHNKQ